MSGFWWRFRRTLILRGGWSDWMESEGEACERFESCGYAGITDQNEGIYEFEVCASWHRPLHGYIDLRPDSKSVPLVVSAPRAE